MALIKEISKRKYIFYCVACKEIHLIDGTSMRDGYPVYGVSGLNSEKPCVSPSIWQKPAGELRTYPEIDVNAICHLFITDGKLRYCGHEDIKWINKVVPMIDLDTILNKDHASTEKNI